MNDSPEVKRRARIEAQMVDFVLTHTKMWFLPSQRQDLEMFQKGKLKFYSWAMESETLGVVSSVVGCKKPCRGV